jgi:hypothetical protein
MRMEDSDDPCGISGSVLRKEQVFLTLKRSVRRRQGKNRPVQEHFSDMTRMTRGF